MINKYFLEEPNILDLSKEIFNAVVGENLKIKTRFELISKKIKDAEKNLSTHIENVVVLYDSPKFYSLDLSIKKMILSLYMSS